MTIMMSGNFAISDSNPSCRNLIGAPPTFSSVNRPPYNVLQSVPPEIQQYTGSIAVLIGNKLGEVVKGPHANAAFIYTFNIIAAQRFQSAEWFEMVGFGVMCLWHLQNTKRGASIESLLDEASSTAVLNKCAVFSSANPTVITNMDAGVQSDVRALVLQAQQFTQAFMILEQQWVQKVNAAANPVQYAQQVGGLAGQAMLNNLGANQQQATPGGYDANPYGNATAAGGVAGDNVGYAQKMDFRDSMLSTPRSSDRQRRRVFSFDGVDLSQPPVAPEPPPVKLGGRVTVLGSDVAGVQQVDIPQPVALSAAHWRPTELQLFKPLVFADEYKLEYETHDYKGRSVVVAVPQLLSESEMDKAAHRVPTLNRAMRLAFEGIKQEPAGAAVNSDLDLIAKGAVEGRSNEDPARTLKLKSLGLLEFVRSQQNPDEIKDVASIQDMISSTIEEKLLAGSNESVYMHAFNHVVSRVVLTTSPLDFITSLSEKKSIKAVLEDVKKLIDDNRDKNPELTMLGARINRFIAGQIEFVLKYRMGISAMQFTDAISYYPSLLADLEKHMGKLYSDAFRDFEPSLVENITMSISRVTEILKHEDEETEGATPVGWAISLDHKCGAVALTMESSEFGVILEGNSAYEIFDTNFPGLNAFLQTVVAQFPELDRIYVATIDKIYSVSRSIIGDRVPIIFDEHIAL